MNNPYKRCKLCKDCVVNAMCKDPCYPFESWVGDYLTKFRTRDEGKTAQILVIHLAKALRDGKAELADNEWGYNIIGEKSM